MLAKSIIQRVSMGLFLSLAAFSAHAVTISSIDMIVTGNNTQSYDSGESVADAINEFWMGDLVCDVSLASLDMAGSVQTCGGPNQNIATWFSIDISQTSDTTFQFGADWGRGGIAFLTNGGSDSVGYPGDRWWALDWGNSDVIQFAVGNGGSASYTLNYLGFEGCCGGAMSLRYFDKRTESWQIATAAPVPEPSTLALFGLGLVGLGFARRRKAA